MLSGVLLNDKVVVYHDNGESPDLTGPYRAPAGPYRAHLPGPVPVRGQKVFGLWRAPVSLGPAGDCPCRDSIGTKRRESCYLDRDRLPSLRL